MRRAAIWIALIWIGLAATAVADALDVHPTGSAMRNAPKLTPFPVAMSPNWTGFWAGGQIGFANVGTRPNAGTSGGLIAGLTAGYDYDFGSFVLGGGFDYDRTERAIKSTNAELENVFRVRLKAGVEIGQGLLYGTGGFAQADTDTLGSEEGYFLGAGYQQLVTPQFSYGGEVIFQDFDNYGTSNVDVDATTIQLRGVLRF
ncbi:MAG: outer membrane beta-barrel protein [Pseudomonadota bacterium]